MRSLGGGELVWLLAAARRLPGMRVYVPRVTGGRRGRSQPCARH